MRGTHPIIWLAVCRTAFSATILTGDAQQGKDVFRTQQCVTCHSVNGEGGTAAPDLGKSTGRDYGPADMAALMWNHAPAMWSAMEKQGITRPVLTEQNAADLFAYFYSARYFDRRGDAAHGKQLFQSRQCGACHGASGAGTGGAKPVSEWQSAKDPIALAQQMWNHSSAMTAAMAQRKIARPVLTSQNVTDLLVYVQNLPPQRQRPTEFSPASAETGEVLFAAKGCAGCHSGKLSLADSPVRRTLTDLAAGMWNHAPKMGPDPVTLNYDEMRRLVGYLWSVQFFIGHGDAGRGKQVFTRKNCATCHNDPSSGAPNLAARTGTVYPYTMVDALWKHGPAMLDRMRQRNLAWPHLTGTEMADLTAFLSRTPSGGSAGR